MKRFVKNTITYKDSKKVKMAIYSLSVGLIGILLGIFIICIGIMDFLGYNFIPIWAKYLRNSNYATIIAVTLWPKLQDTLFLLQIFAEIEPYNKAFKFIWETPIFTFDVIKPDIFLGIILSIIGLIFLSGVNDLFKKKDIGVSHLVVGSILSIGIGIIYFLILLAHGGMFLLGNEEYLSWKALNDFSPAIWLAFLSIPGGLIAWQIKDIK
ncbi:MAG: hypothetical protein ACFFCM_13385 [Promethearchaeota archaeon]